MARDTGSDYAASNIPQMVPISVPSDRLEQTTPALHKPTALNGLVVGTQLTGTVIAIDDPTSGVTRVDIGKGRQYYHQVRNVRTYSGASENTWGVLNVGDPVYYDRSAGMPAGVEISTSPLDQTGAANPLFGYIGWAQDEIPDPFQGDRDPYPTTTATAVTEEDVVIIQA